MSLCFNLMKTDRLVQSFFDKRLKKIGITAKQFYIILTISQGRKNITGYAKELGLERTVMARNLITLEKLGLVSRSGHYSLTESGIKIVEKCIPIMQDAHNELFDINLEDDNKGRINIHVVLSDLEDYLSILKEVVGNLLDIIRFNSKKMNSTHSSDG